MMVLQLTHVDAMTMALHMCHSAAIASLPQRHALWQCYGMTASLQATALSPMACTWAIASGFDWFTSSSTVDRFVCRCLEGPGKVLACACLMVCPLRSCSRTTRMLSLYAHKPCRGCTVTDGLTGLILGQRRLRIWYSR